MAYSTRRSLQRTHMSKGIDPAWQPTLHEITLPKFVQLMSELGVAGPRQRARLSVESVWYEKLGEGSQFQVYKHTEVALVAKRVEVRNMVNNEETQLNDLELEIRALAEPRIYEHPNIVDLLDWGYDTVHELAPELQAAGRALLPLRVPVLYLEPANEGSLAKFLEISRDWATRVKLCLDIAAALECLHGCRIIHNDLKPDNVLIFRTDEESQIYTAKLADFGFALPSDRQKDLSFFEYGNTQAWKPPESIDYSEKMHGIYTDGLLFKSESFAYGMLALFILFSPAKSSPHPFNRDPLRRRNEITSRLESNTHLASREDMTEAWQAIETSFLVERPESRRSISPSVLQFGDSVIDVGEIPQISSISHTSNRRAPLSFNTGWRFYASMPPHLCELLDEGRSKEFEGYHGDLLFGMALSKATARLQGFREDVKTLIRKAASATPASIRAKGIFKQIEAAISYQASEEEAGSMSFASLYEVAATGSIIARSEIQKTDPDAAEQSSLEFRCRGGYNRESVASKSEYTEIKRRIALDASSNGRLHSNECEYSPEFHDVDNMEFSFGNSLLHVAAAFGVCDAISELASQEHLDLDPRNFLGETPLYKACMAGQHEAAIMLLDLGANPCIRVGRTQVSCLHWLFTFGPSHMYQITEKLTSCGLKADEIATPIVSVQGQDQFVFEEAIHYPFHWPIGTPLHWAAHMENVDAVNHLKAIGVDVDVLDMPGDEQAQTALSMAMYRGSATMVKHLLSLGASPTRADGRGRTPLHMLAGDSWIQNRLFKIPSNLQQWCQHGHFNVCLKDLKDCVEAVKDFGAPLDGPRHRSNRTPLADAVEDKNVCAVIALLDSGADANKCQDRSGRTSLHLWLMVEPNKLAYPEGYFLALEKLIHATTIDTTLLPVIMSDVIQCDSTSWRQKLSTFEKLSAHTIDINLQDGSGKTLLMTCVEYAASSRDCLKGVRWMLERGAAVAMRDNHGRDLLWYAAHNREIGDEGCLEILKLYLECASETSKAMVLNQSKDSASGKTALMAMCSRCYYSSVRLAIQTGVDLNDHDRDGVTALDLTLETGNSIRLALWDSYLTRYRRLPTRSDNISDDMFQRVAFGDSSNQSRTSNNKVGTHKILYMTFPKLARCLIEAGAQTGQQLQYRSAAPDIKYRERLFLEENGIEDFVVEDQPYYHLWQEWYQYDNTTKNEDEAMEVQRKGWSIPLEIRKQLEREQAEVKSSSSR